MRDRVLAALEYRALSQEELANSVGVEDDAHELMQALYHLNAESLIVKHPITDGCKTCACHITYKWRLTYAGRQYLNENLKQEETQP